MNRALRRFAREEEGISLVEMLVSLMIIGVVLSALANTLMSSNQATRQSEGLTQATQVATETLEDLQALPWSKVGLYDNDGPGWSSTGPGGLATVSLGPVPAPRDPLVPVPQKTVVRDDRSFTVDTDVVWRHLGRYKQFRVQVSWNGNGGTQTLELQGRRSRRLTDAGSAAAAPAGFRITSFTVNPDPVYLDANGRTNAWSPPLGANDALDIKVETNEPAQSVSVTWPTAQSATLTEVADSGGLKWTATAPKSSPAGQVYPHGFVTFTATATKAGGGTTAQDTTAPSFFWAINRRAMWIHGRAFTGTPAANGDYFCVQGNNKPLSYDHVIRVDMAGMSDVDNLSLERIDVTGPVIDFVPVAPLTTPANGYRFEATLAAATSGNFIIGLGPRYRITGTRLGDLATMTPFTFDIYAKGC